MEAATDMLRMLADGTRLRLMWLLSSAEHDVTTLVRLWESHGPRCRSIWASFDCPGSSRCTATVGALDPARGGHVRRLVSEVMQAASHRVTGAPEHD